MKARRTLRIERSLSLVGVDQRAQVERPYLPADAVMVHEPFKVDGLLMTTPSVHEFCVKAPRISASAQAFTPVSAAPIVLVTGTAPDTLTMFDWNVVPVGKSTQLALTLAGPPPIPVCSLLSTYQPVVGCVALTVLMRTTRA